MAKITLQWSAVVGKRGHVRTRYVNGRAQNEAALCVVRPEGTWGTVLTDWRPDRLHRPHFCQIENNFFSIHPPPQPEQSPCWHIVLSPPNLQPWQRHLSETPTNLSPLLPQPSSHLSDRSAPRHSQMSTGSCDTETLRLLPSVFGPWKLMHLEDCWEIVI